MMQVARKHLARQKAKPAPVDPATTQAPPQTASEPEPPVGLLPVGVKPLYGTKVADYKQGGPLSWD